MPPPINRPHRITRRQALKLAGAAGLALAIDSSGRLPGPTTATAGGRPSRWDHPDTWRGRIPGRGDVAVISHRVVLHRSVRVRGLIIERGGSLIFAPRRRVRLTSTGNVVVRGRLSMRPRGRGIHRIVFRGIDEARLQGGGMDVLPSDVGLWVMGSGVLSVAGARKLAWTRATGPLRAGATALTVGNAPVGWRRGDVLAITPTGTAASDAHHDAYDTVSVAGVSGRTVTLSRPLRFDHPAVNVGRGRVMTAEVLNLTRNVRIEGTPGGRAHVFIRSSRSQSLRFAALRHVGPRKGDAIVTGRYGVHFHHCGDGSRRSLVEGVVVHEAGNHAFVPHMSNGVTFRDCIAHDTVESAYWWDLGEPTKDVLWHRCVASRTLVGEDKYTNEQFTLGTGTGNACISCVAVGGQGIVSSSGFEWPSKGESGVWRFEDCVAHNIQANGIFVWQVDSPVHFVDRFIGYHCGAHGIFHGSYANRYHYRDGIVFGCGETGLEVHAVSKEPDASGNVLRFERMLVDQAGRTPFSVQVHKHIVPPGAAGQFVRCEFRGATKACIGYIADKGERSDYAALDCVYAGNEFWFAPTEHPDSVLRVRDPVHGSITLKRGDQLQSGAFKPVWNAVVG